MVVDKIINKRLVLICSIFGASNSYANIEQKYSLSSIEEEFSIKALVSETNNFKIQDSSRITRNDANNINQEQLAHNLTAIEAMQFNSGSGIYFKQTRNNYTSMDEAQMGKQNYNNSVSGRFAINAEEFVMASINEGQTSFEQLTMFNGDVDNAETKNIGVSLAYNKRMDDNGNMFAFIGKNWVDNEFGSDKKMSGDQISLGIGLHYKSEDKKLNWMPQINVQKIKSNIRAGMHDDLVKDSLGQTTATLGLKTKYQINNQFSFAASINYEKDLDEDKVVNTKNTSNKDTSSERYGVALSMVYKPAEKMNLIMDYKHKIKSVGSDNTINVAVRYHF